MITRRQMMTLALALTLPTLQAFAQANNSRQELSDSDLQAMVEDAQPVVIAIKDKSKVELGDLASEILQKKQEIQNIKKARIAGAATAAVSIVMSIALYKLVYTKIGKDSSFWASRTAGEFLRTAARVLVGGTILAPAAYGATMTVAVALSPLQIDMLESEINNLQSKIHTKLQELDLK